MDSGQFYAICVFVFYSVSSHGSPTLPLGLPHFKQDILLINLKIYLLAGLQDFEFGYVQCFIKRLLLGCMIPPLAVV